MGDFNNQLHTESCESYTTFKPGTVATHMLVLMVRGLFTSLEYPYAQFTTAVFSSVGCGKKFGRLLLEGDSTLL